MAGDGAPAQGTAADARLDPGGARQGRGIIRLSWLGTALYVVVAGIALLAPETTQLVLILVCVGLFLAGTVAFAVAYLIAVGRSRHDAIGMGGLFFLAGSAPPVVQRHLLGSFAVQLVVSLGSAAAGLALVPADADNPLAFGILTPLYGLGLAGLWAARYGVFSPRPPPGRDRVRPSSGVAGEQEGSD